jgi:hypothetical protein
VCAKYIHISDKPDGTYSNQQAVEGFALETKFGPVLPVLAVEKEVTQSH